MILDPDNEKCGVRRFLTGAIPFVMDRCKPNGGFAAAPTLPATVEDTYFALKILHNTEKYSLRETHVKDGITSHTLRKFLESRRDYLFAGSKTSYRLLFCYRVAGLENNLPDVRSEIERRMAVSQSLEDWYYGTRILMEIFGVEKLISATGNNRKKILSCRWRSVDEAWMYIYLSRILFNILPQPLSQLVEWFRACQNGDGGFGFFPRTTSYAENCYSCLRALSFLGARPLSPERAYNFLCYCRTNSGGFGRSLRAVPFLDTTWYVLAGMMLLSDKNVF